MTEAILIGVASSFIASCMFLFALYSIRPKIEIVENIAKDVGLNGKTFYVIKVINRARRAAVDVRAELRLMTYKNVDNGHVVVTQSIKLVQPEIFSIPRYRKGKTGFGYRFSTFEDLDEKWPDDSSSYLSFKIYAKDSLTGFGKVFSKQFRTKNKNIVPGKFSNGESTEIC